ncbi:subtilisin-like protease [Bidens hawaiensis]|uniref:subtilisin-like protease n=1 Tax=Bidens hawaiensis TaxID=980011 RepID=UPI00404A017C
MSPTIGLVFLLTCTTFFNVLLTKATELKTNIVHLSSPEVQTLNTDEWYDSFLLKVAARSNGKPVMVFKYYHVITGFAAKMSADQVKVMESLSGVLSVRPEGVYQLQTTRSPHFLGLHHNSGLWKDSNEGKGVIIGLIDTGVTPSHPSFKDDGVPPPPSTWKGKCEVAGSCNNKLIGLRNFVNGRPPVDEEGHGTHTSSTAAGNYVDNARVFGLGNGTASGIAPLAHVATYKVCEPLGCLSSVVLAGMDAAIEDGVNVLSLSLGGRSAPFYIESIALGAFIAMQKGIFVSCAAANSGPASESLSNEAPWILTVGASTIDRRFQTTVILGNKKKLHGESLYQQKGFEQKLRPLVYPQEGCHEGSLDHIDVKGKVVLCDFGAVVGLKSDPEIASFSSRGPNLASPGILKPDITGPGVDILAAWNEPVDNQTGTKAAFNVIEGTSMSCPHLAGIGALLKSVHPEWSPAAIKSAIMTTASQVNRNGEPIVDERGYPASVHAFGSGHVNPQKALEPGLIFDIQPEDYIPYLCGLGYTPKQIEMIVKKKCSCSKPIPEAQLNYPSFVVSLERGDSKTYSRTVTNVGPPDSGYTVRDVSAPEGVSVTVLVHNDEGVMRFNALQKKRRYEVTFSRDAKDKEKAAYGQGHMTWVDETGKYIVRTPFSFKFE